MMTMINEAAALKDLKRKYEKPGDPLYMAGIQTIKDHYKSALSIEAKKNFFAKSRSYTIHYEFKPEIHNPYYIRRLRQMIQIDLTEISQISEYNKGYNYILVAIDCFSRKVWARLLMTKTADEVLSNFQSILNETGSVESIRSDRGKEFVNKKMKKFLFDSNIELKNPYTYTHAPFVERVQSTLQNLIYKHITKTMNLKFYDKLQDIIKRYNNRKHRITKLSPNQGEKKENTLHIQNMQENYRGKIKPTKKIMFKIGDHVRIAISKPKFGRGYDKKSNKEIYKIVGVITKFPRVLYKIVSLDGDDVTGLFYQEQITKVLNQDEFIIEKVLESTKNDSLVKFLGYSKPEWIPKENITTAIKDIQ